MHGHSKKTSKEDESLPPGFEKTKGRETGRGAVAQSHNPQRKNKAYEELQSGKKYQLSMQFDSE